MRLEPYNFTIIHHLGRKHNNADALSRMYEQPTNMILTEEKELPSEMEALQTAIHRRLTRIESSLYQNQQIEQLAAMLRPNLPPIAKQDTQPYTKLETCSNSFKYDNGPLFDWNYI